MGFTNAWLCGFTDADGSFGFRLSKDSSRNPGVRLRIYWYLDQSFAKKDLERIQTALNFGYIELKTSSTHQFAASVSDRAYRYQTQSIRDCQRLCKYFETYPPLTPPKKVRFIRWKRVLNWHLDRTWVQKIDQIHHLIELNRKLK